jgi:glycosyltransferase involved in cell wall biosynthesis
MARSRRPRVHVIVDTDNLQCLNACAVLRLVDPFSHPVITESFDVSFGLGPADDPIDILVMQRQGTHRMPEPGIEELVLSLKSIGTRLLYDLDDNLLDAHPDGVLDSIIETHRRLMRFLLRHADRVTVSTPVLRDRLRNLNSRITVLPNVLNDRRFPKAPPGRLPKRSIKIGYFGTLTHTRDLLTVAGPLRAAFSELRDKATLVLCGISPDGRIASLFNELVSVEILPVTEDYESFMKMMRQHADWDIGLAPLAPGEFEAAKSDIKFLEYAAFGVPGLYSVHPAYASVRHGVTGMLATPDQWTSSLQILAGDADLRARIVAASREYLFSERTLTTAIHRWSTVLNEMLWGHDDA